MNVQEIKTAMGYSDHGPICKHCKHWGGVSYNDRDDDGYKCTLNPVFKFRVEALEDASILLVMPETRREGSNGTYASFVLELLLGWRRNESRPALVQGD